ncbi:MAG TPA: hypothetical protein GX008_09920 [Firmicutes bacterium]|jgi:hypothetical protein|nr:MAG: hypothetical protein AA931_08035 [Peptococcaceae bacterium 1109]HHT74016.1 hypothetical protein [Bacillota bacterium]
MKKQRRQDCETGLVALRAVDVDIGLFLCSIRRRYTTAGIESFITDALEGGVLDAKAKKQIENLIQGV